MTPEEQQHFMQLTVDLSQYALNSRNGGPFGAIIVKNGKIVGSSVNFLLRDTDPCAHAEAAAIRDACRNLKSLDLSGCQIFSISEPCPMCMAAIYWAQVKEIYYCNSGNTVIHSVHSSRKNIDGKPISKGNAIPAKSLHFEISTPSKKQEKVTVQQE